MAIINLYSNYQLSLQTGDVIEWRSNTLLGWCIRGFTKQNVNHTSVVMKYELCGTTEMERRYVSEATSKGVQLTFLSDKIKNHDGRCYLNRLKREYEASRIPLGIKLQELEGVPYDWGALFKNIFMRPLVDASELHCMEALQVALIRCGLLQDDFNDGRGLVPGQLLLTGLYEDPILIYSNK